IHQCDAGGVAHSVRDFPLDQKPGSLGLIKRNAGWLKKNIIDNKLEANLPMAETLTKMTENGSPFTTLESYLGNDLRIRWQDDFLKAPSWKTNPGLAAKPQLAVTITWNT